MSDDNQDAADDDENSLKRTFPRPRPGTFNKECPEYSLLLEMLRAGKFSRGATPKAIWESRPEFQRFTLSKFRYGLRFAKSEAGFHVRPADDGPALAKRKRVATGTEGRCFVYLSYLFFFNNSCRMYLLFYYYIYYVLFFK